MYTIRTGISRHLFTLPGPFYSPSISALTALFLKFVQLLYSCWTKSGSVQGPMLLLVCYELSTVHSLILIFPSQGCAHGWSAVVGIARPVLAPSRPLLPTSSYSITLKCIHAQIAGPPPVVRLQPDIYTRAIAFCIIWKSICAYAKCVCTYIRAQINLRMRTMCKFTTTRNFLGTTAM